MPWWVKIIIKIIIARLPLNYQAWQKIQFFKHGAMDDYKYAVEIFNFHLKEYKKNHHLKGKTILELGPGDSIVTALISSAYGAKCILSDVGSFATKDIEIYKDIANNLRESIPNMPDISSADSLDDVLNLTNSEYLIDGLKDLKSIESNTVDIIFSEAVLEHVRKDNFLETLKELNRILKRDGFSSHNVDLKDHLDYSLNNLRFSEKIWESDFMMNSGFYTNRLQYKDIIELFQEANFKIETISIEKWDKLPVDKKHFASPYNELEDELLNISGFHMFAKISK